MSKTLISQKNYHYVPSVNSIKFTSDYGVLIDVLSKIFVIMNIYMFTEDSGFASDKCVFIYELDTYQWIFQTGQSKVLQSQSLPLSLMSW